MFVFGWYSLRDFCTFITISLVSYFSVLYFKNNMLSFRAITRPILEDPLFVTLQRTLNRPNLTKPVANVIIFLSLNNLALAVVSMAGYIIISLSCCC